VVTTSAKLSEPVTAHEQNQDLEGWHLETIQFGKFSAKMIAEGRWKGTRQEDYPSSQGWADDIEAVLQFLDVHSQLPRLWTRLTGPSTKGRDNALAEGRIGYWLSRQGFEFVDWEPNLTGFPGEFTVHRDDVGHVFIEAKQPGWDGELSRKEREAGRHLEYRYKNGEVRSLDPDRTVLRSSLSAVRKMKLDRPNVVVVDCSRMFRSPVRISTRDDFVGVLRQPAYEGLGGLLLLDPCMPGEVVEYHTSFIENPSAAGQPWSIPAVLAAEWTARNGYRLRPGHLSGGI
jgi:hypothetical protein